MYMALLAAAEPAINCAVGISTGHDINHAVGDQGAQLRKTSACRGPGRPRMACAVARGAGVGWRFETGAWPPRRLRCPD
jgi:hypothetical protein